MKKTLCVALPALLLGRCAPASQDKHDEMPTDTLKHKYTNRLIHENSPYLLQHAHNPVNWYPWGEEAMQKARETNKPLLISIGYSACHWCHVMERESFEDEEVARLMNEHFICIKVDREEHPDVDQVYMNAIQLLGRSGGWPLNCFAMPDGRPFHAGTYYPKAQWLQLLQTVSAEYKGRQKELDEFAQKLTEGIRSSEIIPKAKDDLPFNKMLLTDMLRNWRGSFDNEQGGPDKAPKFPLPNNYIFLLRYAHLSGDEEVQAHLALTLQKMAYGGIFDQLGGGFARYSTDRKWKVPHFEKMLYDNAQLVSLYSEAFTATGNPLYKQVVFSTLDFIKREMTSPEGAFYSGLDADSEGEEGRFYTWTKDELGRALGKKLDLFSSYYNVNEKGLWENGRYILLRDKSDEDVATAAGISVEDLLKEIEEARETLMKVREKRPRPALDDKALTSWNALMLQAYVHAYTAFGEQGFLQSALRNASFILNKQMKSDGGLFHSHRLGRSSINGYLEDYAAVISAFISLYEATLDEQWLHRSENLATYVVQHFYDKNSGMFWFTSEQDSGLVARKMEISDNVIPSSNSIMANNLFLLGMFLDRHDWRDMSDQMLRNMLQQMPTYGPGYSNWGILLMKRVFTFYEIAFSGAHALKLQKEFNRHYIPNKLITGSTAPSTLPLLENKFSEDQTRIYVCVNSACKMPVTDVAAALAQIRDL